ncbi:MAG: hypothetical protein AB8B65_12705 [Kordia sp.]|uniref:hypothetical protein n=1 Tax=Kordia sp. TaxID=1965332 RepID=UPI00385FD23A
MAENREEILLRLKSLGLIIKDTTINNLIVSLNDILNDLRDNEIKLLEEFERIHKRKVNGDELSYFENLLYDHIRENYTKK